MIKIAIDAMGGDFAPAAQVQGAVLALEKAKDFSVVLVGDEEKIRRELSGLKYDSSRVEIVHAPGIITNDDVPTKAVRTKKDSSTVVAFELLKEGRADALVSSGATGAVLTAAVLILGRIRGISRPALCPRIPNLRGTGTLLCDCGANLECKPVNLVHFAMMATAYAQAAYGMKSPKVGLLSNGTEDHKGDALHQEANALLRELSCIDYAGNVEGRDIMVGDVDIVVADGFTGNIALKSIEGCGKAISGIMKREFKKNLFSKLRAAIVYDVIKNIKKSADYETMGGAMFLGLKKAVVKAHGNSKPAGFAVCVGQAVDVVRGDMVGRIEKMLKIAQPEETAAPAEKAASGVSAPSEAAGPENEGGNA